MGESIRVVEMVQQLLCHCHRVIGEDGSLTGYGGGLQRKKWLLDLERKHSGKTAQGELFA